MIAKVFLLALLVAVASATPLNQDPSLVNYGVAVDMYLKAWKNIIRCGFAQDNIPVLAPFTKDFYAFDYVKGETNIVGNVSNIRISGLDNFQVLSGFYHHMENRYSFDVIFPEVQILGSYELEGTLSIAGYPMPVRQSVLINKKVVDWRFVGDYTFGAGLSNSNGLRISDFNLKYYIADVKVDMWDKFLDIAINNYMNNIAASSCMLLSEEIQPYVKPILEKFVLPKIDNQLANVNLIQLTEYLLTQAEMWSNAGCGLRA